MKLMKTILLLMVLASVLVGAGCNKSQEDQTQEEVSKGAQSALDKTKQVVDSGWKSVQKSTAQMSETAKIKNAVGSSDVDTSNVSVNTIGKTVYMIGNVPTQAMKDKADKIAKDIIDKDYTLEDNLKVGQPRNLIRPNPRISRSGRKCNLPSPSSGDTGRCPAWC